MRLLLIFLLLLSQQASAAPLVTSQVYGAQHTDFFRNGTPGMMIVKGIGDNNGYMLEVDPATGELPVSLSGGSISIDFSGPTGDPVPANAGFVGGVDGSGDLRGLRVDTSGELQVDVLSSALPSGAATEATLSAINTKTPALGQTTMAASSPVAIASNQSAIPVTQSGTWTVQPGNTPNTTPWLVTGSGTAGTAAAGVLTVQGITSMTPILVNGSGSTQPVSGTVSASNFPATVDTNSGANGASTLRVTQGSRTYADSFNQDYGSGNVTTGAWTQLIASTAAAINLLCVTDTSGQVMELGTGAPASETRVLLIAQGWSGCVPLRIAASARVAVRAVTATASSGYLTLSGMN